MDSTIPTLLDEDRLFRWTARRERWLLGTVRDRLKAGAPLPRLALGIAAWMRYVAGTDEKGRPIDVRDPMAATLRSRGRGRRPVGRPARAGAAGRRAGLRDRPAADFGSRPR